MQNIQINASALRSHLGQFFKTHFIEAVKRDKVKRQIVYMYAMLFALVVCLNVFVLKRNFSFDNLVMYFGLHCGLVTKSLLKEPFGTQAAWSSGIVVAIAFVMISVFFRILL